MLNKVFLQGRLGSDPELRTTPNGVEVAAVSIAVERDRKDAAGERLTDWVNIVAWRQTAKFLSQYFKKGRMAIVEGRLQMRGYTDRDGIRHTVAEVVADNVYFGDNRPAQSGQGDYPSVGCADSSLPARGTPHLYDGRAVDSCAADKGSREYGVPDGADAFAELGMDDGELPF